MNENRINNTECPYCGYEQDTLSSYGHDDIPSDGALAICLNCASPAVLGIVDGKVLQRVLTQEEWQSVLADESVARARVSVLYARHAAARN